MGDSQPQEEPGQVIYERTDHGRRSTFKVKVVSGEEGETLNAASCRNP